MTWRFSHLTALLALTAGCKSKPDENAPSRPTKAPAGSNAPETGHLVSDITGSAAARVNMGSGSAGEDTESDVPGALPPAPKGGDGPPTPGQVDTAQSGVGSGSAIKVHGSTWANKDPDAGGGQAFAGFKESWVYVDGVARGVLLYPEIPQWLPVAWKEDVEGLDFKPGDPPPYERKVQLLRYRLVDYLKNMGLDINKVKGVYLHGSGYTFLPHDMLVKYADGITFDFTGNDMTKTRFYWPIGMPVNTSYDRYAAVSVILNKPLLTLDEHNNPFIDGVEVSGIPYHGTPERGGVRVYLDGRLTYTIKRNLLNDMGRLAPDEPRWSLRKLLEAAGTKADNIAAVDVVDEKDTYHQTRERMPDTILADLDFATASNASGEITLGKEARPANAILLYTKGHVPKPAPLPPLERDYQKGS